MAIISCPFCQHKISDKAAVCGKCGNVLGEVSAEELHRIQRERKSALANQLNNHAMLSLLMFLSSFIWYYYRTPEPESIEMFLVYALMISGCGWYLLTKVRIVLGKRK